MKRNSDPLAMCPRCGSWLRMVRGDGTTIPGALSRRDNETEICSRCGRYEALEDAGIKQKRAKWFSEPDVKPVSDPHV